MARIRTIKPEFWEDEKIAQLPMPCRLFYIGCWNFADDFGIIKGNATLLKSWIFPYDEDLRVSEIKKWIDALVDARMLVPIISNGESYYIIRTFRSHQVLDKRYERSYLPKELVNKIIENALRDHDETTTSSHSEHIVTTPAEKEMEMEKEYKENKPKGLSKKDNSFFPIESVGEFKVDYARVENLWKTICKDLPQIQGLSEKRKLKIRTRLKEMGNSYEKLSAVLIKLNESNFCKGDNNTNWKASFDWLFDSPNNWRKVLEGNYDNKTKGSKQTTNSRLGIGEFIRDDGTRTYGSGKVTIPANAPPRPGERYYWNASNESWAL